MQDVLDIAGEVAAKLGEIDGVAAVGLGGAWAHDDVHLESDIDLQLYYYDDHRPDVRALRGLAQELNSFLSEEMVTDFWASSTLLNGGAWLWVEGRRVNWLYRDIAVVRQAIGDARHGIATAQYQPGYPHGFFSHYYLSDVHYARRLFDPDGLLLMLKAETDPYPEPLRRALIHTFLREADLALFASQRSALESDVAYAVGAAYRAVACMLQVVFALNRTHFPGERHALARVEQLPQVPASFSRVASRILSAFGVGVDVQIENLARARGLLSELEHACVEILSPESTEDRL